MIKLPAIFSSGALYQHSSVLTLRGSASGKLDAAIIDKNNDVFSHAETESDNNGDFSVTLNTPYASLNTYKIALRDSDGEIILENILFGELWLASGQSNMELYNVEVPGYMDYLEKLKALPLRAYRQNVLANKPFETSDLELDMPIEPTDGLEGIWCNLDDYSISKEVSAAGTAFIKRLYECYTGQGRDIPVGFVNSNIGGTLIEGWLPYSELDEDDETSNGRLKRPDAETWNTFGGENFLQCTALYNLKIYPLRGLKFAGIVWYQGESNIGRENCYERYKRYLRRYYDTYKRIFGTDDNFHIVMSLLFPFSYGNNSECLMSCINNAMSEIACDEHEHFTAVPIYDLSPIWGYEPFTHPIHPLNKYPVGERLADAFVQKATAPTLANVETNGSKLRLSFNNLCGELYFKGKRLYGLYIRGENTPYMEADGEIINGNILEVSHPYIEHPIHVAYQLSSIANDGNLYGKYLPVAQFCTEYPWNVTIERKAWLFTEKSAAWFCNCLGFFNQPADGYWDYAMHPTWMPLPGSEVCSDPVFKKNIASLRISGDTNIIGAYIKSRHYNELDFQNYEGMRFMLLNADAVSSNGGSVRLELHFHSELYGEYVITCHAAKISETDYGWAEFSLPFGTLPEDKIISAAFVFDTGRCRSHFVNLDCLRMVPKGCSIPAAAEEKNNAEKKTGTGPVLPSFEN